MYFCSFILPTSAAPNVRRQIKFLEHVESTTDQKKCCLQLSPERVGTQFRIPQTVLQSIPGSWGKIRECPTAVTTVISWPRLQCRLTGHCTMMPLSTYVSSHQSTSRPDKDFSPPLRTICVFLLSDCRLLDVVLSLSLAHVSGTLFLSTSLQHLLCSVFTFRKRLKLHLFSLSYPGQVC